MDKIKLNRFYNFSYHGFSYLIFIYASTYIAYEAYCLAPNAGDTHNIFSASIGKPVVDLNSIEVSYYNGMKALNDHYFHMLELASIKKNIFKQYIDNIQKRYYDSIKYGRH